MTGGSCLRTKSAPAATWAVGLIGAALVTVIVVVAATLTATPDPDVRTPSPIVEGTLTGHTDSVCAVAMGQLVGRR